MVAASPQAGETPLHFAAQRGVERGGEKLVRMLLDAGSDKDAKNKVRWLRGQSWSRFRGGIICCVCC